jgi:hypothetical protein
VSASAVFLAANFVVYALVSSLPRPDWDDALAQTVTDWWWLRFVVMGLLGATAGALWAASGTTEPDTDAPAQRTSPISEELSITLPGVRIRRLRRFDQSTGGSLTTNRT